jgi:hypothetical protein
MSVRVAGRRKFPGAARGCRPSGMRPSLAQAWRGRCALPVRDRADGAIAQAPSLGVQSRKIRFEAGEFRPGLLRLAATGALAVRGCLYEIVYEMRRVVPCFAGDICDFFPPFRGVLAAHYVLPSRVNCTSLYAQPRRHYVRAPIGRGRRAYRRSQVPRPRRKTPDLPSA